MTVVTDGGPAIVETEPGIVAFFEVGGATPAEAALAQERFKISGLAEGEAVYRRFSVFDTDEAAHRHKWSDALKAKVEALLDSQQSTDYFKLESAPLAPPWPAYNDTEAELIAETAKTIGVSLESVLAYERENENRAAVIKALEEASAEAGEIVVAA